MALADIIQRAQQLDSRGRPIAEGISIAGQALGQGLTSRFADKAAQERKAREERRQLELQAQAAAAEAGLTGIIQDKDEYNRLLGAEREAEKEAKRLEEQAKDREYQVDMQKLDLFRRMQEADALVDGGDSLAVDDTFDKLDVANRLREREAAGGSLSPQEEMFLLDVDRSVSSLFRGGERPKDATMLPPELTEDLEKFTKKVWGENVDKLDETKMRATEARTTAEAAKVQREALGKPIEWMSDEELAGVLGMSKRGLKGEDFERQVELKMIELGAKERVEKAKMEADARRAEEEAEKARFDGAVKAADRIRADFKGDFEAMNAVNTIYSVIIDPATGAVRTATPKDFEAEILKAQLGILADPTIRKKISSITSGNFVERFLGMVTNYITGSSMDASSYVDFLESVKRLGVGLENRIEPQLRSIEEGQDPRYIAVERFRPLLGYQGFSGKEFTVPDVEDIYDPTKQKSTTTENETPPAGTPNQEPATGGEAIDR